jgi:hypothetical protein
MEWVVSVTSRPRFSPGERTPGTHCTGGWVDPRASLDTEDRGKILLSLLGIEHRSPGRPVRNCCHQRAYYSSPTCIWVWRATVEWWWQGKPKNSEKNLSQCHFAHHKPYADWPGREPGLAVRGRRLTAWAMVLTYITTAPARSPEVTVAF